DIAGAMEAQGRPIRIIAVDLDLTESVSSVPSPKLEITSEIVEAALSDAETLIGTSGAPNALDRVHTAFQAYLEAVCEQDSIAYKDQSNITALFGLIRQHHPRFQIADSDEAKMVWDILRGMARVVDG